MNPTDTAGLLVHELPAARRSLRVALLTETYPPEVNGVALTVARVVEGLQQRNHEVQLIRPRQSGDGRGDSGSDTGFHEVLMRGLPIPRYPHLRMGVPDKRALVRLWSVRRPDIVHIATEGPLGWSALQAAVHLRLPVSSDFRTNFHAYSRHYGVGWLRKPILAYLRKFHNRAHCTMVPTEALRKDLEQAGFRHLEVVARGVDARLFDPARRSPALRAQWGVREDELVMLCVGRVAAEKNLDTLLEAWAETRRHGARVRLVVVGDGPLRAELARQHPDIVFAGQRKGDDLAAHYASADLFVFPSLTETFGNVVTEALASGLPLVAYDYAAAARFVRDGVTGVLVPFGQQAAFVEAVRLLARDPERRARMGPAARATACSLGWDRVVDQFEGALLRVLDTRPQALPGARPAGPAILGQPLV